MATYTPTGLTPTLLTSTIASLTTFGNEAGRMHLCRLQNLGLTRARAWLWLTPDATTPAGYTHDLRNDGSAGHVHGANDALLIYPGDWLYRGFSVNVGETPIWVPDESTLWGLTDFADYGTENAAVLTTAEIVVGAGAGITYAATTVTDTGAAYTASANNADLVGRRIEAGGAYLICTSNTGTVITGTDGWRDKTTGLQYVNTASGNLYPTSGGAGHGYTVLASLRDTRETTLAKDAYAGHLITAGSTGARRQARLVGNNAGIATYGTTFQILVGGWPTGTPTAGKDWSIDSLVSVAADWIQRV